ncbi:MAG TPA: NADH-quinone oxidoreductase subunit J [Betaproteobacteria bacterium]|jgi:NADH-quinone oxidoreductase subunit J|nr:NADH-quinone oxidoreductase subunit J [Betaproteobacteria bacterium]
MTFQTITFYLFSFVLILSALGVITSRNPVYAALFLVLSFVTAAGLWMLLFAEFLALTLILVYVGAVMVLFLFVVMMLDINFDKLREGFRQNALVAALVGVVMLAEMAILLGGKSLGLAVAMPGAPAAASNTKELGRVLYTEYLLPFELAAVVLLIAMIAAIALTLRERRGSKSQDIGAQVRVKSGDRLKIIKMDAAVDGVEKTASGPVVDAAPAALAIAAPAPAPLPAPGSKS